MRNKIKYINRKNFLKIITNIYFAILTFFNFPYAMRTKSMIKNNLFDIIKLPQTGTWNTNDPFLFCVHHHDIYPKANNELAPDEKLIGREIGNDFSNLNGWSMYHGKKIPGFPRHPHRGFETITIVEKGLIDHSDSLGNSARYGDGDVQWLTAGDGIEHSEMFPLLNKVGSNPINFFQIWINLKSDNKRVKPNFSMFWKNQIPKIIEFDEKKSKIEIELIAGEYKNNNAPNPPTDSWASDKDNYVNIWKISLDSNANWKLPKVNSGISRNLYIYSGTGISINNEAINIGNMIKLKTNNEILIKGSYAKTKVLLLQAKPINEPVVKYGPFVMNTRQEIKEAFDDYNNTSFGNWDWNENGPVHGKKYKKFALGEIKN